MAYPDSGVSLYLHVPFCSDKCLYCDFYSVPQRLVPEPQQAAVVDQTLLQARRFLDALDTGSRAATIFVGGGTPSVLPHALQARLLGSLRGTGCAEWTVEANPESIDGPFLDLCGSAGVSRLSIGVQSLRDPHLALLRRRATRAVTLAALQRVKRGWTGDLNLDFIAGIPGQTPDELRQDLAVLEEARPCHVSLYQLTREPGTALARLAERGEIRMNAEEEDEELWLAGKEELEGRGYRQYEISNFCMPGKECLHNVRYWRMEPYAGAGPGAVSTLPAASLAGLLGSRLEQNERTPVVRLTGPRDFQAFLRGAENLWGMEIEGVGPRDFLLENLMMGLRLAAGIPAAVLRHRFGTGFDDHLAGLWARWTEGGLAEEPGTHLRLTETGRLLLDRLLGEAAEMLSGPGMESIRVSWP